MKKRNILKSLLNLSAVSAEHVFYETHQTIHQHFSQFHWLLLLYAPGHTLIYYPSHIFPILPRENASEGNLSPGTRLINNSI